MHPAQHDRSRPGILHEEESDTSQTPAGRAAAATGVDHLLAAVREFHQVYGCATDVPLASAPDELLDLRVRLTEEELGECISAMSSDLPQLPKLARELADLAYVVAGTAVAFGLELPPLPRKLRRALTADCGLANIAIMLQSSSLAPTLAQLLGTIYHYAALFGIDLDVAIGIVHRSNLSKIGENGQPIFRDDGKVLKGPNFVEPDLRPAVYDFSMPTGSAQPPWWLDGIETHHD